MQCNHILQNRAAKPATTRFEKPAIMAATLSRDVTTASPCHKPVPEVHAICTHHNSFKNLIPINYIIFIQTPLGQIDV